MGVTYIGVPARVETDKVFRRPGGIVYAIEGARCFGTAKGRGRPGAFSYGRTLCHPTVELH